jgi:hypothetical protein
VSDDEAGDRAASPPTAQALLAIAPDDWAWLLGVIRGALHDLPDDRVTAEIERFRASPASRLAGGRMRTRLARLIADGGPVWFSVHAALGEVEAPDSLAWLRSGARPGPPSDPAGPGTARAAPGAEPADTDAVRRLKARARSLRDERDDARRRLRGAEARAEALTSELAELTAALEHERERSRRLEAELAAAAEERTRQVERERRRGESRLAELEAELREVRRRDEARRQERARRQRAREIAEARAEEEAAAHTRRDEAEVAKVRPGRPTSLPSTIARGTREEAAALLGPGRLVLIDGYNVTLQHQQGLTLEQQRAWLVQVAASLAARRRVRPTVVFDGRGGGGSAGGGSRGVAVIFTPSGTTADDEIVLAVQATDEPVVVVTDDNELRDRVRVHGADVLHVPPFLWVAS